MAKSKVSKTQEVTAITKTIPNPDPGSIKPIPDPTPIPIPDPTPIPIPEPTPQTPKQIMVEKINSLPVSPIKVAHYFNNASQWWDYAAATELARKLGTIGCLLRGLDGIDIAKNIQTETGCDIVLVISYGNGLEFDKFGFDESADIYEKCLAAKNGGLNPSDVIFHYEGNVANARQCNLMYEAAKCVWPNAVIGWYDYPGWHMGTSGFATKEAVPTGTLSDTVSYNLYMTTTSEAFMTMIYNLRTPEWNWPFTATKIGAPEFTGEAVLPAAPWVSLMGTYADVPQQNQYISSQWGWRRDTPREPLEMYNLGKIVDSVSNRYPFRMLVAYPGSFDHRYDMNKWLDALNILIRGLRGDPF